MKLACELCDDYVDSDHINRDEEFGVYQVCDDCYLLLLEGIDKDDIPAWPG